MSESKISQSEQVAQPALDSSNVLLAVYAPFGGDTALSLFPEGQSQQLAQHPLYASLLKVAAQGVHVYALVDLAARDTYLIKVEGGKPAGVQVTSAGKQQMASRLCLAHFLASAHRWQPRASIVLTMEGHGAGFLPEIDGEQLAKARSSDQPGAQWVVRRESATLEVDGKPIDPPPQGAPALTYGLTTLPTDAPTVPGVEPPLSTWALGAALKAGQESGVPKLSVIHFNNCFNMSVELLHTVAPYAQYATGYINYNFFTAGVTYPSVFEKLKNQGSATAGELAAWFALANGEFLAAKKNHPTVGCSIELSRMAEIAERVDDLSDALLAALRVPDQTLRGVHIGRIKQAVIDAQQLDTGGNMQLQTPDEMTDLYSLAVTLQQHDFGVFKIHETAKALARALGDGQADEAKRIKRYGADDQPWTLPSARWDFSSDQLAMSIFLPDPLLQGLWDWRSAYYLNVNPTPVQPQIIDFLQTTDWIDFLIEYHRTTPFVGLLPAAIPEFPVFNKDSDKLDYPKPQHPCRPGKKPKALRGS